MVISTGSLVQSYIFSLLNSEAPSIYGSAYKEALVEFPPFEAWLRAATHWFYVVPSAIIALVSATGRLPRVILWRSAIASTVVLCAMDGTGLIVQFRWSFVAENVVSNVIGGILIGCLVVAALSVAEFVFLYMPAGHYRRIGAASVIALAIMLLAFSLIYYLMALFYKTMPVEFDAYASLPVSAGVVPVAAKAAKAEGVKTSFSLIRDTVSATGAEIYSMDSDLKVIFASSDKSAVYDVNIALLSGVCEIAQLRKIVRSGSALKMSGVSSFAAFFDKGSANLRMIEENQRKLRFSVDSGEAQSFGLTGADKANRIKVWQFLRRDGNVVISDTSGSMSFALFAPTVAVSKEDSEPINRKFTLEADARKYEAVFSHNRRLGNKEKLQCVVVPSTNLQEVGSGSQKPVVADLFSGVLVTINRKSTGEMLRNYAHLIKVVGVSGWVSLDSIGVDEMAQTDIGELSMVQLKGNIVDLLVNSTAVTARAQVTYTAVGDLRGSFGEDGKLRISGMARKLWRDKTRMSPTKWEVLSWEARGIILGILGSVCSLLWPFLIKTLQTNQRFVWMD